MRRRLVGGGGVRGHLMVAVLAGLAAVPARAKPCWEVATGPLWASHWSTQEAPPGTSVQSTWYQGVSGGVHVGWRVHRRVRACLGITSSGKGARHVVRAQSFPWGPMDLAYEFHYLGLPLTVDTHWVTWGPLALFTTGGGYAGYLVRNTYTFSTEGKGSATHSLDTVGRWDVGFVAGGGIGVSLGRVWVVSRYRFEMGLRDLSLDTDPRTIPEFRGVSFPVIQLRNMSHGILVGLATAW